TGIYGHSWSKRLPARRATATLHGADVPQEDFDHHLHHAGAKRSAQALARAYQGPHSGLHPRGNRHGPQALRARPTWPDVRRGGGAQEVVKIARWAPHKSTVTRAGIRAGFGTSPSSPTSTTENRRSPTASSSAPAPSPSAKRAPSSSTRWTSS